MATPEQQALALRRVVNKIGLSWSHEVAERVERLFHACHPILGPTAWQREYTPEEVFAMGMAFGERMKRAGTDEPHD